MADSVSFKAYLARDEQEVEVRRFAIDAGAATNFLYLRSKIQAVFPSLTNDRFIVYWQDQEEDSIIISSDEELVEALSSGNPQPFKLYVHTRTQEANNSAGEGQRDNLAWGVCDICDRELNLCSMLRMLPTPLHTAVPAHFSHPKFLRKWVKHQHKLHKHLGRTQSHKRETRGQESAERCSFRRPACAAADMFDFTALLHSLSTQGVGRDTETARAAGPQASASAQTGASTSAQPANAQATSTQANTAEAAMRARARAHAAFIRKSLGLEDESAGNSQPNSSNSAQQNAELRANNYLNGIGQAITAFLDPFGVDVTFDVRSKGCEAQQPTPAGATATTSANGPSPSTSTAAPSTTSAPIPSNPAAVGSNTAASSAPATTTAALYPELPTPPSRETSTSPRQSSPSDDWTLLNHESPVRGETVAVDVDKKAPCSQDTLLPPASPPSPPNTQPLDAEKKRIDDCLEKLRAMGFDLGPNTQILRDLLTKENCDIASVLDILLNNARK